MNIAKLRTIKKLYFGYEEIARSLGVAAASARVSANRYVRQGLLIRLKRNIYAVKDKWDNLSEDELFCLANICQVPSYVSLMTALGYYGITTQVQRKFVESIAVKRTKELIIDGTVFNYVKINKKLYGGFVKKGGFFIAAPEKALLDALYLKSLKRYSFDLGSIDFSKVNMAKLRELAKRYPRKLIKLLGEYGHIRKA
jgi:predicted transcriptional regulator of viral defense system